MEELKERLEENNTLWENKRNIKLSVMEKATYESGKDK
jgi:hypothetical protein